MDLSSLRTLAVLKDFSDAELADLLAGATEHRFPVGSLICREGERDGHLYCLVSGEAEVSKTDRLGRSHPLARLGSGTLIGELSWIMDTPCAASVQARQECAVIRLDGQTLTKQLHERSPGAFKLGVALLRLLAGRLMHMNDQFLEIQTTTHPVEQQKSEIERLRERILHDWSF